MTETVVIAGQGYVGLPLAVRAAEVGHFHVVGFDVDAARVKQLAAGESYVEDVPSERLAAVLAAGTYRPTADPRDLRRLRHRGDHGADPAARRRPDLAYIEAAAAHAGAAPAPGLHGGAGVDHLPGHHRGAGRAAAGGGLRAARRPRLPPRLQPRADRPGQPGLDAGRARPRWSPASTTASLARGPAPSTTGWSSTPSPVPSPQGGRAGQAAGEHVPARQHRAGQRDRDVRPRPRHRRLGGDRRGVDQAVRLHALHPRARASAGTACRSTRRTCPGGSAARSGSQFRFVELANDINDHMPDYVVQRLIEALNRRRRSVNGSPDPAARPGLQEEHRRRPGVARRCGWPSCCSSWAPRCAPPTRTWSSRSRWTAGWSGSS